MDAVQAMNNFNQTIMAGAQMIQANKSSKADRKMVQRENQKSRDWNEKMWRLQNEFNSPTAQLARFVDAGLNPALAYGEVTSGLATNPTSSYGQGSTNPDQTSARMAEAAQLFNQMNLTNSAIHLNDSQAEANEALADKYRSETTGQNLSNTYEGEVLNTKVSQIRENLKTSKISNELLDFEKKYTLLVKGLEYESWDADKKQGYNWFTSKRDKELLILARTITKMDADINYTNEAKSLLKYNAETGRITANAFKMNAENYALLVPYLAREAAAHAGLYDSQSALTDKQAQYYEFGVLKTLTECYNLYKQGMLTDQNILNVLGRNFNLYQYGTEEPQKGGIMGSGINIGTLFKQFDKSHFGTQQNNVQNQTLEGVQWLYNMLQSQKQD